jgi:hypothetical protein
MTRKKGSKAHKRKMDMSASKIMFLSIILLFIVFEALYIVKGQAQLAQNSSVQQVAGVKTSK